ncbi:transcriptional regulator CynR [Tundrisphaera lichenicola]|uniref:transcriptional regulator CynR n=1 Tax=Tundrisphaera lichenicola TaxID=2029860 RepID=UPI003EBF64A7
MELRHLRYFLAVADALHFTRAAEVLHVSQPTLSLQIMELERMLGAPLFDRTGRTVRLTEAGHVFRRHAIGALREVETGTSAVSDLIGLRRGNLKIGVTHSFSTALIPKAVARFRLDHPGVGLAIEKTSGRAIEQALVAGTLNLGIAYAPPESAEIVAETLFEEEVVLIVASGHPLADRSRVGLSELAGHPLALISREFSTRRLIDDRLREAGVEPVVAVEMNDIDSLLEVVRLGNGATVLSRRAVNDGRGLAQVPIQGPRMARTAALLWHREAYRTSAAIAFATAIRAESTARSED